MPECSVPYQYPALSEADFSNSVICNVRYFENLNISVRLVHLKVLKSTEVHSKLADRIMTYRIRTYVQVSLALKVGVRTLLIAVTHMLGVQKICLLWLEAHYRTIWWSH